jgi:hypothetical protein
MLTYMLSVWGMPLHVYFVGNSCHVVLFYFIYLLWAVLGFELGPHIC